jgi:hypothetical protein
MNYNRRVFNYNNNIIQNEYQTIQKKRLIYQVYFKNPINKLEYLSKVILNYNY